MNTKRRDFIKNTLALGLGASTIAASQLGATSQTLSPRIKVDKNPYSFYGPHQQGIATPAQKHIYFMVLDLHTNSLEEISAIFKIWQTNQSGCLLKNLPKISFDSITFIKAFGSTVRRCFSRLPLSAAETTV